MSAKEMLKGLVLNYPNKMDIPSEYHITEFIYRQMMKKAETERQTEDSAEGGETRPVTRTRRVMAVRYVEAISRILAMEFSWDDAKKLVIASMDLVAD